MNWDDLVKFLDNHSVLVSVITGGVSGTVATFVAPWVNWGIEKKKTLLEERRKFLKECRELVQTFPDVVEFRQSHVYARLRPVLSQKTVKFVESLESPDTYLIEGGRGEGVNNYVPDVLDDIAKLERKWGLL